MHLQESLRENRVSRGYEAQTATQFLQSKSQSPQLVLLRIDAYFLFARLPASPCEDEHFFNP